MTLNVQLNKDGDQWCALLGPNIAEGFSGWGETPVLALQMLAIDINRTKNDGEDFLAACARAMGESPADLDMPT